MARRVWRCRLSILTLLLPLTAAGQGNQSVYVTVQTKQDSAAALQYGAAAVQNIKDSLEHALFTEIKAKFPCSHYLDDSAVATMLSVERQRQLLGSSNDVDSRLAQLGASVGARYLIAVSVQESGDKVAINGTVLDDQTAKAICRSDITAGVGQAAIAPIDQFAHNLVAGMSSGPKCTGFWSGTVTITTSREGHGQGSPRAAAGQ